MQRYVAARSALKRLCSSAAAYANSTQAAPRGGRVLRLLRQDFERVRGHVRAGLVRDLAEVAERDAVEPELVVVDVEGAPAAARGLHADDPVEAALHRLLAAIERPERERDDGGVVDVRVEVVLELEGPAARGEVRPANRPVALDGDLLAQEPFARGLQRRVGGRDACLPQGQDREGRVPKRRLSRLGPAS